MRLTNSQLLVVIVVVLVVVFLLVSCEGDEKSLQKRAETLTHNSNYRVTTLMYIYDPRVDICYAVYRLGHREGTITVVPYEKVKHLAHIVKYEGWDVADWEEHRRELGVK